MGRLACIVLRGLVLAAWLVHGRVAVSAEVEFQAEIDRELLSMDETLVLTLRLSGAFGPVPTLDLRSISDFAIVKHSQGMGFTGGARGVEVVHELGLRPLKTGELTIPAFTVELGGTTYQTRPLTVMVTDAPASPSPSPGAELDSDAAPGSGAEVELQASVAPRRVYVGQQATYRLRVLRRIDWMDPQLEPVKFEGFWVEELDSSGVAQRIRHAAQTYLAQDLLYALFPSAPGLQKLEPRTLRYSGFGSGDPWRVFPRLAPPVLSNAVELEVLPLPEAGRPQEFSGAVGKLEIVAKLDRAEVRQDQAVTLTLIVSGVGNPSTFPQPHLALPAEIEAFETKTDLYVNKKRDPISGTRTFKTVLVPRAAGRFKLGPFELWAFDPYQESYVRVTSAPVELGVEPGKPGSTSAAAAPASTRREELRLLGQDIRYLKPVEVALDGYSGPLLLRPSMLVAFLLPVAGLAMIYAGKRHWSRLSADRGLRRRRQAARRAQERLRAAEAASDVSERCRLLELAVLGYVTDRFDLSISGASRDELLARLQGAAASEGVLRQMERFLDGCAFHRFASAAADEHASASLLDQGRSLLAELQREIGTR